MFANPTALVMVACLAAVAVLAGFHRDTSQVMIVVSTVLGLLYGKVDAIQQQSNGNMSQLLDMVRRQSEQLAAMMPPPTAPPPGPRDGAQP